MSPVLVASSRAHSIYTRRPSLFAAAAAYRHHVESQTEQTSANRQRSVFLFTSPLFFSLLFFSARILRSPLHSTPFDSAAPEQHSTVSSAIGSDRNIVLGYLRLIDISGRQHKQINSAVHYPRIRQAPNSSLIGESEGHRCATTSHP